MPDKERRSKFVDEVIRLKMLRSKFRHYFTSSFYKPRFQKRKKTHGFTVFFALLGSACVKAARSQFGFVKKNNCTNVGDIDYRSQYHHHFIYVGACDALLGILRKAWMRIINFTRAKIFGKSKGRN